MKLHLDLYPSRRRFLAVSAPNRPAGASVLLQFRCIASKAIPGDAFLPRPRHRRRLFSSMAASLKIEILQKSASQGKLDSDESLLDEEDLRKVTYDNDCLKNLQSLYLRGKKVQSTPSQQAESLTGDSHHPTIATYGVNFRQTNPSTLPKEPEILPFQSEMRNHLLEMENRKLFQFDTRKERLENFGYESISDEETDALPRFPFTYAAARVDRDLYTLLEKDSRQEACEWPVILEEANKLAGLHKRRCNSSNTSDVTEARRFHKGRKRSSRFKFSIQSLARAENLSWACSWSKDETYNSCEEDIEGPAEWNIAERGNTKNTTRHLLKNILEERAEQANKPGFHILHVGAPSVSELLENLQNTNDPSFMRNLEVDNIKRKERPMSSLKRTSLHLGNRILDNKDPPEFTVGDTSEDEFNDRDFQSDQNFKGHTMADLFQEAFKTSTVEGAVIPRSNKFGYHGRLQRVMQLEKERYMECSKQIQEEWTTSNDSHCINVKILSRTLEAKLTVCQCLFAENSKLSECEDNQKRSEKSCLLECSENGGTMKKTVIFSPKNCSNVELEVGNKVFLHPPWKEVQVNVGETIILCTYFSQRV